jgi:hypothetical protein
VAPPIAAPVPSPAPAALVAEPAETPKSAPAWGLLARGGYFGLPNFIADELFLVHPDVKGSSYGFEIRYNGEGGRRNGTSVGIAVDIAKVKADGEWQQSEMDKLTTAGGDISMLAITVTKYWYIFPSWYVHPYIGFGIGAAHAKGFYKDESERVDADVWIPVIHIPVGLACEFGERIQVSAEGRFIDGIAIGASLQLRF